MTKQPSIQSHRYLTVPNLHRYRGSSEDELLNREGVSPQEYLEFTENFDSVPPPENYNTSDYYDGSDTDDQFNYFSVPGEPGLRGPPGVRP